MKNLSLILIILAFGTQLLKAESTFLMPTDIGVSAYHIGIGNIDGFAETADGVFENAASLVRTEQFSISAFTANFIDDFRYLNFAASTQIGQGALGIGYVSAGGTDIFTGEDSAGRHIAVSAFDNKRTIIKVAYQHSLSSNLSVGLGVNSYAVTIRDLSGSGNNLDIGVLWEIGPLGLSSHARNIIPNSSITYDSADAEDEDLPFQWTNSAQLKIARIKLLGQWRTDDGVTLWSYGGQYKANWLKMMTLSAGRRQIRVLDQVKSNWAVGLSLDLGSLAGHYAFEQSESEALNGKHYFSFSLDF